MPTDKLLDEIPRMQRRPQAKPLAYSLNEYAHDPQTGMAVAYLTGDYTMKTIAGSFGVHYSTVSRAVKAYEKGSNVVLQDLTPCLRSVGAALAAIIAAKAAPTDTLKPHF